MEVTIKQQTANLKGSINASGNLTGKLVGTEGKPGKDGVDGYTPQKGIDYFTEADKLEIAASVDLTNYVKNTDYATYKAAGVVRVNEANGIKMASDGHTIVISRASNGAIDKKEHNFYPIVPSNLDYAVKMALIDSKLQGEANNAWTDEEKASARALLGAAGTTELGDIEAALDSIIAIQNDTVGGGSV